MIKRGLPTGRPNDFSTVINRVSDIMEKIRREGEKGLIETLREIEGFSPEKLILKKEDIDKVAESLPEDVRDSIDRLYSHILKFHEMTRPSDNGIGLEGVFTEIKWIPIRRVGIYVPGGRNAYPSTLLMTGIPAKVAGVKSIAVATPPKRESVLDPAIAYAAKKVGVSEIILAGGAQAIASFTFGLQDFEKVDKIVGPGNIYVQAAKYLASQYVGIDGIEGPTELVLVSDGTGDYERIAMDILAQGEHGPYTLLVVISTSERELDALENLVKSNEGITVHLVRVKSIEEGISISNTIAPEHLSLHVKDPARYESLVTNAGTVTMGDTAPASIDYYAGVSHVLPTNRWAAFRSGLTVYDFLKIVTFVADNGTDIELVKSAIRLAKYEGFETHAKSIGDRYGL